MAKVKVLVEGYAKELANGWRASSTCCLITTNKGKKIITDPGCNREKLLGALKKEGLKLNEIDYVFLTHGHVDHAFLAGIFDKAKAVTFENLMYDKDLLLDFEKDVLGSDTKIINTPGHSPEHISLLVDTKKERVAIAGDVFWWADSDEQIVEVEREDDAHPAELNMKALIKSRKLLLKKADYIIPGHGRMFKVKNDDK